MLAYAKPGNLNVVFRGGFMRFVIRRGESDGKFRLVGECYVYGIMRGELASMVERESLTIEDIEQENRSKKMGLARITTRRLGR